MVDVAVTGTFAGDLHRLSIDAVMPGVRRLEKEAGSVLRGLKKKKSPASGVKGLPAMINFPDGMERFIDLLAIECGDLMISTEVTRVGHDGKNWLVSTDHEVLSAPNLVMALPVNAALLLLKKLDNPPPIDKVPGARIANVVMGFGREAEVPRGFGYLAPEVEDRFALGAMFSSHMFPDRCPADHVLIEALVGGRRHPERLELTDAEIIDKVYEDISRLMHLPNPPVFTKVLKSPAEIPQLEMDHPALLAWRQELEKKMSGLHICGFGWDGIGMNDVIKSAARSAEALVAQKPGESNRPQVKPVYF
jgi:oxygen-dependent protoporphyrinogen oxidase